MEDIKRLQHFNQVTTERANLVVRPEKLGDLVIATPVFRAFKESFPDQPLHLLVDEANAELVRNDPHLDKIITIRWKGRRHNEHEPWYSIYSKLNSYQYQRAALLYGNLEPLNWLMAALRVPQVAQFGGTYSAFVLRHQHVLRGSGQNPRHFLELYLDVAAKLGASTTNHLPELVVTTEEKDSIAQRFPFLKNSRNIFIHAFSLTASSNLSARSYFELARFLSEHSDHRIHLLGTARELESAKLPVHPGVSTELIGNLNSRELLAACSCADLVIGGSSGIVHIAAALGTPTIGLYCPSVNHHLNWGPRGVCTKTLISPPSLCRRLGATTGPCQSPKFCDLSFAFPHEMILDEVNKLLAQRHP